MDEINISTLNGAGKGSSDEKKKADNMVCFLMGLAIMAFLVLVILVLTGGV